MREINAISIKKHSLWTQLEQIYFVPEFKSQNKTDLRVCKAICLQTMCVKLRLNVGKLLSCRSHECLDWIQNLGLK